MLLLKSPQVGKAVPGRRARSELMVLLLRSPIHGAYSPGRPHSFGASTLFLSFSFGLCLKFWISWATLVLFAGGARRFAPFRPRLSWDHVEASILSCFLCFERFRASLSPKRGVWMTSCIYRCKSHIPTQVESLTLHMSIEVESLTLHYIPQVESLIPP